VAGGAVYFTAMLIIG